jgi:hypothetical protein
VDVVELPPCVSPTCCLANPASVIQMVKTGIRVGLQRAREIPQVLAGMLTLAIRREDEPYAGRSVLAYRSIIAHVGPEPARLRLPIAGLEHRHRRVLGVQIRCKRVLQETRAYV